jgi:hypothetical protein
MEQIETISSGGALVLVMKCDELLMNFSRTSDES